MGTESKSRSESFNEWWYDYRLKNGLGDHTAKAEVALAAFNAGQQVSNSAQAAGTQSAPADTAPVSERMPIKAREFLETAACALEAATPDDCCGMADNGESQWPIKDEIASAIRYYLSSERNEP